MKKLLLFVMAVAMGLGFMACGNHNDPTDTSVTTYKVEKTDQGLVLKAKLQLDSYEGITYGFQLSTCNYADNTQNGTEGVKDLPVIGLNSQGEYTMVLTMDELLKNQAYYIRGYVTNASGFHAGNTVVYAIGVVIDPDDPHPFIDMGAAGIWATFNVGAEGPSQSGDFFAWGETAAKNQYSWNNYSLYANGNVNKYTASDNKKELEAGDDAATKLWGEKWRTPTIAEWQALDNAKNYRWVYTFENEMPGYRVESIKGDTQGNAIFLPMGGYKGANGVEKAKAFGYYWSSTVSTGDKNMAQDMEIFFEENGATGRRLFFSERYWGQMIRPVRTAM